jgi:D-sedoheptulose 7-phosphate isomerase
MDKLVGELEGYFDTLATVGRRISVTDSAGRAISTGEAMAKFLAVALAAKRTRNRVMFVGNGGSAAICSHMATDWMKNGGFHALSFNDGSMLTCLGNDLGYEQVFAKQVEMQAHPGDLLVAISSSGNSVNILNAVAAARDRGASVITMSGFKPDNKLRQLGDVNFYVPDQSYGFVEISHLTICHAVLDISMGWRAVGAQAHEAAAAK